MGMSYEVSLLTRQDKTRQGLIAPYYIELNLLSSKINCGDMG